MIHRCKVECRRHSEDTEKLLGENPSVWLPYAFLLDIVTSIKMASDDDEDFNYECTTIYIDDRSYIIDTPYRKFEKIWIEYMTETPLNKEEDLEL